MNRTMTDGQRVQKHHLRQRFRAVNGRSRTDANSASAAVCRSLLSLPALSEAQALCGYVATFAYEPDIGAILEHFQQTNRPVFIPRFDGKSGEYRMAEHRREDRLDCGRYGIGEPRADSPLADEQLVAAASTVWCIPGMAFDRLGNRLGRGGGFYDRLLQNRRGTRIGVTFSSRLVDTMPVEEHDIIMDAVVTEQQTWLFGGWRAHWHRNIIPPA